MFKKYAVMTAAILTLALLQPKQSNADGMEYQEDEPVETNSFNSQSGSHISQFFPSSVPKTAMMKTCKGPLGVGFYGDNYHTYLAQKCKKKCKCSSPNAKLKIYDDYNHLEGFAFCMKWGDGWGPNSGRLAMYPSIGINGEGKINELKPQFIGCDYDKLKRRIMFLGPGSEDPEGVVFEAVPGALVIRDSQTIREAVAQKVTVFYECLE